MNLTGYKFTSINTSIGHTCGNVTSMMLNHIKNMFPPTYFKNQYIGTSIALNDFKRIISTNGLDLKKDKPIVAIQPKLSIDETDFGTDFVKRLFGHINYNDTRFNNIHDNILISVPEDEIFLFYNIERMKMEFSMTYVVSTELQQYHLFGYMINKFRFDHPYYYPLLMELELPYYLMEELAKKKGVDLNNTEDIAEFIKYLNSKSSGPISYKLQTSTGRCKFFIYVSINLYILMSGRPSINDGDKDGQTKDDFTITHDIVVEFNYINIIHYAAKDHSKDFTTQVDANKLEILNEAQITPMYSLQQADLTMFDSNGYKLSISAVYDIDTFGENAVDVTDIKPLFDKTLLSIIEKYKTDGIPLDELISFRVFKDDEELKYGVGYKFDPDTFELTTYDCKEFFTYRIALYVNQVTYNHFVTLLYDKK